MNLPPRKFNSQRSEALNIVTVVLLEIGLLLFGIGYIVGLWLFVTSNAWSLRMKIIGIAVVPGGAIAGFVLALNSGSKRSGSSCVAIAGSPIQSCSKLHLSAAPPALTLALGLLFVVAPIGVGMWLMLRASLTYDGAVETKSYQPGFA